MSPEEVWRGNTSGVLPIGGFQPNSEAEWVDILFPPATATYVETLQKNVHGENWKQQIVLPIAFDSPLRAEAIRVLSRGRWLAIAVDGNDVIRLVGTKSQPLKLASSVKAGIGRTVELSCETFSQAYFLQGWDEETLYGNPADFSFEFLPDFNA